MAFSRIEAANDGDVDCICQYDFDQQFNEFTTLGGSFFEGKNGYVHKTDDTPGVKCYIVLVSEYVSLSLILILDLLPSSSFPDLLCRRRARRRNLFQTFCGRTLTNASKF